MVPLPIASECPCWTHLSVSFHCVSITFNMLLFVQSLEAKATARLVQTLTESTGGQAGVLQGLQHALKEQPDLREALKQLLQEGST